MVAIPAPRPRTRTLVDPTLARARVALDRIQRRVRAEQQALVDLFREDDARRYLHLIVERYGAGPGDTVCGDRLEHPRRGIVHCDLIAEHPGLHHHGLASRPGVWWA